MRFCLFAQRRAWFINLGCGRESERDWEREQERERENYVCGWEREREREKERESYVCGWERERERERRHVVFKSCFNVAKVFPSQRMNPGNRCDLSKKKCEKREKFWSELERILIHLAKKTTNDVLAEKSTFFQFSEKVQDMSSPWSSQTSLFHYGSWNEVKSSWNRSTKMFTRRPRFRLNRSRDFNFRTWLHWSTQVSEQWPVLLKLEVEYIFLLRLPWIS